LRLPGEEEEEKTSSAFLEEPCSCFATLGGAMCERLGTPPLSQPEGRLLPLTS